MLIRKNRFLGFPAVQIPNVFSILFPLFQDYLDVGGTYDFPQQVASRWKPGSYGMKKSLTAIAMNLIWKMDSNSIHENLKKEGMEKVLLKTNISVTK